MNVIVSNNYFSLNLAQKWDGSANNVCVITKFTAIVQGNFFYNNVGHYVFLYDNSQTSIVGLRFVNNTLYKNGAQGLNVNYGATILCNGAAEILGNVLQNPNNRYQISTTMRGSPITVNATSNWWGESVPNLIYSVILDKTTDYRLSMTIVFQPFVKLPPQTAISVSCPPEWIKDDEMCFMYKGGSFTFSDAKKYCESYGGNLNTMISNEDKRLIKHLRQRESLVRSAVLPSLWTISRRSLKESHGGYVQNSKVCPVVAASGNISQVHCADLHPFVCVRRPVIHCPNSCFHNGDCIGATCFCHPGWTGEDCSKFHCHDLHNCSGNGQCMGPNVCKCYPGYLGIGCTFSFCGKYESCADCVTDPFCGWCDSSRSCRGGFPAGPLGRSCLAWFYYHCYTVGDEHCSRDIMRVNCRGKYCNFKDGRATIESCQKCRDLERCHKLTEESQCTSWNETQCPGGKIVVNYTDPLRRDNVEFAKNVKFVEPNETLVYACPVILPKQDRVSLVLVAPRALKVQKGDILCSPQAGGIMHKIVKEIKDGPFQLMLSTPAGFEEIIKYADFKEEVTAIQVDDGSTFEDEPDQDDLWDVISGNITFDEGRVIVLSNEIYKCLGHTYDTGKITVHSYFLVIEKNNTTLKTGDVVVSNASDGFIETVVAVHRTNNTEYLETKFQRCEASSHWQGTRLQESKKRLSGSVPCSGGDNNEGLVFSKQEDGGRQFSVNDSIIGRPSGGFIAKVIDVYSSQSFLLVEVISAKLDGNGTIITAVDIHALKSHNRRSRRSTRYDSKLASFKPDGIHHKLLSTENAKIQVSLEMLLKVTMFLEIEKRSYGFGIEDATVGLELKGSLDLSLEFRVEKELKYNKGLNVMREKQLGRSIYIRVGPIKIPAGIFLEITGHASAELSGKISRSLSVNGKVSLGGECRWRRGSCYKTADTVTLRKGWNSPHAQLEAGASVKVTVKPKISVKLPAFPKSQKKAVKILDFSLFDDLVEAVFERVDLSMAVYVSVPLEAGLSIRLPATQCSGNKPAEFESFYGISGVNVGVSVGFLEKHLTLEVPLGYSKRKRHSNCICPVQSEKICLGPPTTRPGPPGNENPTTDPNPRPRPPGIGNPTPAPNPRPRPPGNRNPTPAPNPRPGPPGTGNPTPAPNPRPRPTGNGNPTPVPSSRPTPTENGNLTLTPTPTPTNKTGNKPPPSGKTGELPCGKGPICAGNRTGPNCTKPDTPLLQNCSGNGNPIIGPKCEALCNCSGGWEGEFCERLIANGGGDPHLETLDGVNFDFFGIGEFWGCKSVKNDFGLQFRFYYYERASLIGGIALKAGRSVVTIMTIKTEKVQDLPITRIDGAEMNATSNSSDPVEISNGTVLLDRQRRFSFEAEENSVVLISLQYDAGVTVTIDVRHSRVMKRQYLNILYSPTAAYKGHTEGLCGFMDNNATNDFIGSDGTLYDDAIKFAESWRITDCHSGSGTRDSWSWNSSNFYHDDVMDITYTDPSYIPTYLLDGISQSVLQIATSMCKSLKISDNKLKSCIFDVAITNDTTFTDQETFKRDCPDQCSGKGRCVNGTCKCIEGWTGKSCDKGSCLNCSTIHGECVKGFCVCDLGWEGRSCEVEATCFGVNNCTSPEHGSCKTRDVCQCTPGYIGANCSIVPTCNDVSNCAGNGICVDFNVCKCKMGWTGSNCAQYSCEQLDYCSVHGSCVAFDRCACDYGWTGVSCALPDCEAVNHCSKKGECISSDKCRCFPGFVGADCSQVGDCSHLANCSGHGVCISTELLNVSCSCYLGFTGDNCSQPTCTTVNNCSAHGVCVEAEFCKCDFGYTGADCSNFSCEAVNYCSGNGKCVGYDLCLCNSSWSGRACSVPDCSAVKNCSDQGNCILPNVCSCYPAFDGAYCDQEAKSNINAPKFNQTFYSATIVENSPVGTVILQVKATDRDLGKNGQIFYPILGDDNIESILTVGGQSGKVYSAQTLDFETNEVKSFNVTMVAADDGYPQKSGITTVQITLLDENDNCPTYIEPPGDLKLELPALISGETVTKVFAVDLDSGVNSDITYSLSKNEAFSIHPKTGVVTAVSDLKNKVYHLTVSASDNGDISCVTDINLTVKVGFSPTTNPLTRSTNSFTNKKSEAPSTHKVGFSPTTNPLTRSTNSFTNKKSEASSTHSPPRLPETTSFTRATTSNVPTRADAVPQGGSIYVVIGGSAAGGVVLLLIVVLVIRKCLGKSRISPAKHMTGRLNAGMDFELSRRM
ncbi:uncharacterized protein LOC111342215 isoform X2 [Stylophora pistillata]|uniref:uncharacterized protein LOC111342215 isoform X2 n=1 Tax=Stylophora pistillata TaxID=50429 RepID=UPI000C056FF5|nr:uncharacterized protein LOC111342215 isoform X2 [Stylophora pistillata]